MKMAMWNEPSAAAVQCANMKPLFSPPFGVKKAGNSLNAGKKLLIKF
jgi:hypothetical protein